MTKEQYFQLRQHSPGDLLYMYYKEKFDHNKHKPLLQPQEFMHYLAMWNDPNTCFNIACKYYENQLNITNVFDDKGKLIAAI